MSADRPDPQDRRRQAWRFGWRAESVAIFYLRCLGYRVLARRFRCPFGEIDIVAKRLGIVAFVEVKARRDPAAAAEAVRPSQARRVERAASAYIGARPQLQGLDWRFDVIVVRPWRWPVHMIDAWRPENL